MANEEVKTTMSDDSILENLIGMKQQLRNLAQQCEFLAGQVAGRIAAQSSEASSSKPRTFGTRKEIENAG